MQSNMSRLMAVRSPRRKQVTEVWNFNGTRKSSRSRCPTWKLWNGYISTPCFHNLSLTWCRNTLMGCQKSLQTTTTRGGRLQTSPTVPIQESLQRLQVCTRVIMGWVEQPITIFILNSISSILAISFGEVISMLQVMKRISLPRFKVWKAYLLLSTTSSQKAGGSAFSASMFLDDQQLAYFAGRYNVASRNLTSGIPKLQPGSKHVVTIVQVCPNIGRFPLTLTDGVQPGSHGPRAELWTWRRLAQSIDPWNLFAKTITERSRLLVEF